MLVRAGSIGRDAPDRGELPELPPNPHSLAFGPQPSLKRYRKDIFILDTCLPRLLIFD